MSSQSESPTPPTAGTKQGKTGGLQLDNPFWRFALRAYSHAGVSECCLTLQNRFGVNVNLMLFCAWAGATGKALDPAKLAERVALIEPWTVEVIEPLRRARMAWKAFAAPSPEDYPGRDDLKAIELRSEQIVCALLHQSCRDDPDKFADPGTATPLISANLSLVLDRANVPGAVRDSSIACLEAASGRAMART